MAKKKTDKDDLLYLDEQTEAFIGKRIAQLLQQKKLSESAVSEDIGQARNYCNQVISGKITPNLRPFLSIIKRLGITPLQFFDADSENPQLADQVYQDLQSLSTEDLQLVLDFIHRLKK